MSAYGAELNTNDFSVRNQWFLKQGCFNPRRVYETTTGDSSSIQIDLGGSGGTGQVQNDNGCCAMVSMVAPFTTPTNEQIVSITHSGLPHDRCYLEANFIADSSDSANIQSGIVHDPGNQVFTFYRKKKNGNFASGENAKVLLQLNTFIP
ncbi:MAG: hypothetical protein ACXADH_15665 [Candidatus Kariarchaeaceae archaeon]|jgi:hypothetical protein